jgi:hypothetical protein
MFSGVLPKVVSDVGPGGPFVTNAQGVNALTKSALENQYYGPNIQSEINQRNALTQGQTIENQYMPQKLQLSNQLAGLTNQWYGPQMQSQIGFQNAQTNKLNTMTPLEAQQQGILNQYLPQSEQARLAQSGAMTNYYNMGGPRASVGTKNEQAFQHGVALDNPQLRPDQIYEAGNVLRSGGTQLSDGTKLNPLSPSSIDAYNTLQKGNTYAGAAVPLIKAHQAEAELKVIEDMSQKDFAPYATTYAGYSPEQIIDTFKTDDASQLKLGDFIASQAAQYEAAQIRNRIAGGEPGISATNELMGKSGQVIKTLFPRLSAKARERATKRLDQYLSAGLKARTKAGTGLADVQLGNNQSGNNQPDTSGATAGREEGILNYNMQTGKFE